MLARWIGVLDIYDNLLVQIATVIRLEDHHKGFQNLASVSDALRVFLDAVGSPRIQLELVRVDRSVGRVLGDHVIANQFIPQTDRAAMDGYAVRSSDVQDASEANPVVLQLVGESEVGETCKIRVQVNQAVAVATGSSVPSGANAVVMVERTKILPGRKVSVFSSAAHGQNISKRGEDVKPRTLVLNRGRRIRHEDIGILKALGVERIRVVRRPRMAVISTGNELTKLSKHHRPDKIVDINRSILSGMIGELGCVPVDVGLARDDEKEILALLKKALRSCDALIVTAGSSVGEKDLVPRCVNRLGRPGMLVHGVAMRPAMPTGLAVVDGKPILSLPGFPISAIFGFRVFVRPLIARLLGSEEIVDPVVRAVLKERISNSPGFRAFVRVTLRRTLDGLVAEPLKIQRSSVLMSLVAANGIVTVQEDVAVIEAGQEVEVAVIGEIAS